MKKRILAIALGVLCVIGMMGGIASADQAPSADTVYAYALLGDVYTPEAGLLSATAPNGQAISKDVKEVTLDWAQGSYIFVYENKTVNLKVYETAPADKISLLGEVPDSVSNGMETQFPGMTAESAISRTDGAPTIAPYSVNAVFWFNGKRVKTIYNVSESFAFTPDENGLWALSYEYTDVFGVVRTVDYPFVVTNDRIIVFSIKEQYFVGNTVSVSDAYGFYNGKRYPVTLTVEAPDGSVTHTQDSYVLSQVGPHTLTASAEVDGQTVSRSDTIAVAAGLQSFVGTTEGFLAGVEGLNHENIEAFSNTDGGLLLDMSAATASLTYHGVVDLNELGSSTPIISFTPNHSYGGSISKMSVTITDVYDPTNSVTVEYTRNSNMTATAVSYDNTTMQAIFGNTAVAVGNYYPLTNSAVSWSTSFNSYWLSPSHDVPGKTYKVADSLQAMNFAFDMKTNTVYSYGNFHLVEWEGKVAPQGYPTGVACRWYPIADLDNDSLSNKFKGFTTGEVYVSLQVDSGRGDVMIHSIGGVSLANITRGYTTDNGILLGDFDGSMPAAVGVAYQLPTGESPYVTDLTCKVTLGETEIPVNGSSFTPEKTGTYTVTYQGINQFGRKVSKSVELECIEKPDLTVSYTTQTVKIGEVYTVAAPVVQGYGQVYYTMTLNGETVKPGDKLVVRDSMEISVIAKDALETVEKTYSLNVDKDAVSFHIDFPRSAICGSSFTFPEANIIDHLTGANLSYEIYADGVKQEKTITLPTQPGELMVEYRTARGSKQFTLVLSSGEILSGADALLLPAGGSAKTDENGTTVTVSAAQNIVRLPYKLSATSLPIQFTVLEENLKFNTMTVRMTDGNGTGITVSVSGLQESQPYLRINGEDTLIPVAKQAQTIASGENEGKIFYAYTLEYYDLYRAMLNSSKIIATIQTDETGVAFEGFTGGVYLDIYPENIQGSTATFGISQIGNQYFYASAFEYGDIVAPMLYTTDFFIGHNNVQPGYVLKLSGLKAYDVLQPETVVTVTVMAPDSTVLCKDADPCEVEDITLSAGLYILKIKATDAAGVKLEETYRFTAEDYQGPAITISGTIPETVGKNDTLKLPGASAEDAQTCTLRVVIFDPDGKITLLGSGTEQVEASELKNLQAGIYRIRYIAMDEAKNVTSEAFAVTVEE